MEVQSYEKFLNYSAVVPPFFIYKKVKAGDSVAPVIGLGGLALSDFMLRGA